MTTHHVRINGHRVKLRFSDKARNKKTPARMKLTAERWLVSESRNRDVYGGEKHYVILADPETSGGEIIADLETIPRALERAQLMAAAPELLKTCDNALMTLRSLAEHPAFADQALEFNRGGFAYESCELLESVLAKAHGKAA